MSKQVKAISDSKKSTSQVEDEIIVPKKPSNESYSSTESFANLAYEMITLADTVETLSAEEVYLDIEQRKSQYCRFTIERLTRDKTCVDWLMSVFFAEECSENSICKMYIAMISDPMIRKKLVKNPTSYFVPARYMDFLHTGIKVYDELE